MKKWIIACLVAAVVVGLAFPVANMLFKPEPVTVLSDRVGDNPHRMAAAAMFQKKCHYCHIQGAALPFYASFPVAKQLMDYDVRTGLEWFDMEEEVFTEPDGSTSLPAMAKIEYVIESGEMPPKRYLIMHWDDVNTGEEKVAIAEWVTDARVQGAPDPNAPLAVRQQAIPPVPGPSADLDARKVALGNKLFHDVRLSTDDSISCATCHGLDKGGTDQAQFATGVRKQLGPINSPTVYNSGFQFAQFWDGRAATLEEQAGGPVTNPIEMASNWPEVLGKLNQDDEFVASFEAVYPDGLNDKNITDAIATFERSLVTPNCPFDRYLLGDEEALTPEQRQGYLLFKEHRCGTCHTGVIMGGQSYEKMGRKADYFNDRGNVQDADLGRYNHTKNDKDRYKFKTPTLRNIEVTFPYFHDGSTKDLAEAVRIMDTYQVGDQLSNEQVDQIAAFLRALTGEYQGTPLK